MPSHDDITSEAEISLAVLQILATSPDGVASIQELVKQVPSYVELTTRDREPSETRPTEELWEQRVRNIKSHYQTPGNLLCEGLAFDAGKALIGITDKGRQHLKRKGL